MRGSSFVPFICDQLADLGRVESRAMFGGHGLYLRGRFFGLIYHDRLYLKTDAASQATYRAHGMRPFRPNARQTLRTYYEVPADIVERAEVLTAWARRAVEASRAAAAGRRSR